MIVRLSKLALRLSAAILALKQILAAYSKTVKFWTTNLFVLKFANARKTQTVDLIWFAMDAIAFHNICHQR
jgi:hypothetical protein